MRTSSTSSSISMAPRPSQTSMTTRSSICTLIIVERGCCSKEVQVPLTPMLQLVHGAQVAAADAVAVVATVAVVTPAEATAMTDR